MTTGEGIMMPGSVDKSGARRPFLMAVLLGLALVATTAPGSADPMTASAPAPTAGAAASLGELELGYSWVSTSGGGETLRPYDSLDSRFNAELDLFFLLPPQSYFDFFGRFQGEHDTQVWTRLDYLGLLDVRLSSERYTRTQERFLLPPPDVASQYNPEDVSPADDYRRELGDQQASVKFRLPMYPAHLRLGVRVFEAAGDRQQIFLDHNCLLLCHTVSQQRAVDSRTDQVEAGADVHLGFTDISYGFRSTRFENRAADPVYAYGPISEDGFDVRPPLELPHHTYPDISSFRHSLNISTNGLGKVALAWGFGIGQRENKDLKIREDYRRSGGDLVWRPYRRLNLALNFRRYTQENDPGPELKTLRQERAQPLAPSQTTDEIQATVNYHPLPGLKLQGRFSHRQQDWKGTAEWEIPAQSASDTWRLTADYRLHKKANLKGSYQSRHTAEPPYENAPTDDWEAAAAVDWHVLPVLLFQTQYKEARKRNDESGREQERRFFRGSLTSALGRCVTLGMHQLYFEDDITRDLTFSLDPPLLSPDVPYEATGTQSLLQISWVPFPALTLEGGASYLRAKGSFKGATAPFAEIGEYSAFDGEQWGASLNMKYALAQGWELAARYEHLEFDDRGANDQDEKLDAVLAVVRRRW